MGKSGKSRRQAKRELARLERKRERAAMRAKLAKGEEQQTDDTGLEQLVSSDTIPQPQKDPLIWTEYGKSEHIINNFLFWRATDRVYMGKELYACVCMTCNAVRLLTKEMAKTATCPNCQKNMETLGEATYHANDSLMEKFARGAGKPATAVLSARRRKSAPKTKPKSNAGRILLKRRKPVMTVTESGEALYFTTADEAAVNAVPGKKLDANAIRNACMGRASDAHGMLWSYADMTAEEVVKWQKKRGMHIVK